MRPGNSRETTKKHRCAETSVNPRENKHPLIESDYNLADQQSPLVTVAFRSISVSNPRPIWRPKRAQLEIVLTARITTRAASTAVKPCLASTPHFIR